LVNYGARLDTYESREIISIPQQPVFETYLSPRINASYQLSNSSVFKASYNKIFNQPPLSEGALVGSPLKPEVLDQYETSIEHQLSSTQSIKIDGYYKNIRRQNDTGILIPFTQTGAFTSLQYEFASVHGIEFSYNAAPKNNVGLGGFLSAANSLARPGGTDQSGAPSPTINDHDQRWTVSAGVSYNFKSGALISAENYFGSGEGSSALVGIFENPLTLDGGQRNNNEQLNLRFASAPFMGSHLTTAELDVDNVFDDLDVLNFNSGFSGTRFQLGRTISFKLSGKL
jgi:outer membrane receptor protein involved in Fe transport